MNGFDFDEFGGTIATFLVPMVAARSGANVAV
jgi:hypothetical protein